jgi:hypothetical protein
MKREYDLHRAEQARGLRFPAGFEISIDGADEYILRLTPSNKIVGVFESTGLAWPVVLSETERGIPARCLILDWRRQDGTRGRLSSGRELVELARDGLGKGSAAQGGGLRAAS